jgi:hypothetical protein
MPAAIKPDNILEITPERDQFGRETSDEHFDRTAFARRALEIVRPPRTTVAICPDARRMRVEYGPSWRHRGEGWALLAIPRNASRRAIALAVAEISRVPRAWALDVLFGAGSDDGADLVQ